MLNVKVGIKAARVHQYYASLLVNRGRKRAPLSHRILHTLSRTLSILFQCKRITIFSLAFFLVSTTSYVICELVIENSFGTKSRIVTWELHLANHKWSSINSLFSGFSKGDMEAALSVRNPIIGGGADFKQVNIRASDVRKSNPSLISRVQRMRYETLIWLHRTGKPETFKQSARGRNSGISTHEQRGHFLTFSSTDTHKRAHVETCP